MFGLCIGVSSWRVNSLFENWIPGSMFSLLTDLQFQLVTENVKDVYDMKMKL